MLGNFDKIIEHCTSEKSIGKDMSRMLVPTEDDYVVIKPKHSAFFSMSKKKKTTLNNIIKNIKKIKNKKHINEVTLSLIY